MSLRLFPSAWVVFSAIAISACGTAAEAPTQVAGTVERRPLALVARGGASGDGRESIAVLPATAAPTSTAITVTTTTVPPTTAPAPATTEPPAPATTTATVPPPTTEPAVGGVEIPVEEAALALISYPWRARLAGWTLSFGPARAGLRGETLPFERRIQIYVRHSDSPSSLAHVIAHEIGHAVDLTFNTTADRQRWRAAREVGDRVPWWPDATSDFDTLAGDFAEAFATWQVGSRSQSRVGGALTSSQLALLVELTLR